MLLNEPPYLNARGRALWDKLTESDVDPVNEVLILQACRLVDTLDRLDGAKRSKQVWISLAEEAEDRFDGVTEIKIVVDGLLAEYRQQAVALAAILSKLTIEAPKGPAKTDRSAERRARMKAEYERHGLGSTPDLQ